MGPPSLTSRSVCYGLPAAFAQPLSAGPGTCAALTQFLFLHSIDLWMQSSANLIWTHWVDSLMGPPAGDGHCEGPSANPSLVQACSCQQLLIKAPVCALQVVSNCLCSEFLLLLNLQILMSCYWTASMTPSICLASVLLIPWIYSGKPLCHVFYFYFFFHLFLADMIFLNSLLGGSQFIIVVTLFKCPELPAALAPTAVWFLRLAVSLIVIVCHMAT